MYWMMIHIFFFKVEVTEVSATDGWEHYLYMKIFHCHVLITEVDTIFAETNTHAHIILAHYVMKYHR